MISMRFVCGPGVGQRVPQMAREVVIHGTLEIVSNWFL